VGEHVIVRQDKNFQTEFFASDAHKADEGELKPVEDMNSLTPYGMVLTGLGSCTGIVLHTYAQYHKVPLDVVELHLRYDRLFDEDCEKCETADEYEEIIEIEVALTGDRLTLIDRDKLLAVSKHCPIHKILAHGVTVTSSLAAAGERSLLKG